MYRNDGQSGNWRSMLGDKLVAPETAVKHVKSGDRVALALAQATPYTLCTALAERLLEIENVVVGHAAPLFNWDLPGLGERFRFESYYLSPFDRHLAAEGRADFLPISYFRTGSLPYGLDNFNVYMLSVTPPNSEGFVNFGEVQIMSKLMARKADLVIAEIDEQAIWVCGDNSLHISEVDFFVERAAEPLEFAFKPEGPEEAAIADTICATVARELIPDRATIQIGVGSTSGMMMAHLKNHHDLGMQTEVVPWGTAPLVRDGIITGRYKKIFPGIVVGSALAIGTPREELEFINHNPRFQLYDFNFTDDIRLIAREEGLISVNNALSVDLTGQIASEAIGPHAYTGTGGQTAFAVGAALAGGKTIIVTPSRARVRGEYVSRIVAALPPGCPVTVPRSFVHYVVTEYGIADLRGKSLRERARALSAIAHPDFRNELAREGQRLWGAF